MPRLLQFTDLHLRDDPSATVRGVVSQRSFEAVLYHARRHHWPADAVLLTGDLADDESDTCYRRLASEAARWNTPVLAVPGNHDDGAALRAGFTNIDGVADGVVDFPHWRVVALDSQVPRAAHGEISASEWERLEDAAATRGEREMLVALHHPPLSMGSAWLDRINLRDNARFRARLGALGVRACLFGHAHQAWDSIDHGVRYLGTPSTGRQFAPHTHTFAETDEPPAYRWLELRDDGTLETSVEWVMMESGAEIRNQE